MNKRIFISPSSQDDNIYATGNTNEQEQCRKIADSCEKYLLKHGFIVKNSKLNSMYKRVTESNNFNADIHIAIHTNATKDHKTTGGTQILLYNLSGERLKIASHIFDCLSPFTVGNTAEKIYAEPDFYEIKSANAITIYCECEFHDTKKGSDFIIKNSEKIGELIGKGVCNYYGIKEKSTIYKVQTGAFSERTNAEKMQKELKNAGFESFIVEVSE